MVSIAEASELLGVSERHVRRLCVRGKLPGSVRRDGGWDIPRTADARLCAVKSPEQLSASLDTSAIAPDKLQQALYKRGLIEQCEMFCAASVKIGGQRSDAMAVFCRRADVPVRSMHRWLRRYRDRGLAGLVDHRGRGISWGRSSASMHGMNF